MRRQAKIICILIIMLILAAWLMPAAHAAAPIYVRPGGDDTNCDGTADVDYPGSGGPGLACAVKTIQKGVDLVDVGGTVYVRTGTYVLSSQVNLNKANITVDGDGAGSTVAQVSGTGYGFYVTASGVTLRDFEIEKTDKTGVQNIIYVGADDITIQDNLIFGQFVIGDGDVSRAMEVAYGSANLTVQGNTIHSLRQPGYLNGSLASPTTGSIANNNVYLTKGWVLDGANMTYTDNTWGAGASANVYDIVILAGTDASYYPDIVAISDANNNAVVEDQRPTPDVLSDVFVDASAAPGGFGGPREPYQTISPAITRAVAGGTVYVSAGTYAERLTINKALDLRGAQYGVDPTPGGVRTAPAAESTVDITGLAVANPNVAVEIPSGVTNVSVDGFTLIGSPTSHYADEAVIRCWDDNLAIRNNIIDGYYAVLYKGNDHLTVEKNRITVNKNGVTVQPNAASDVVISGNSVVPGTSPAADAAGIYLTGCTDCEVTGNSISGFSGGNAVGGSNLTQLEISGNVFSGCKKGINFWGNTTFVDILNNTISSCSSHGINIKGQDINISDNTITGNALGIEIAKHTLDTERVTIYHNTISGSTTLGLLVDAAVVETVDAEYNYWGSTAPADVAAEVSGNADYVPWCNSDFSICTFTMPVHNITQATDHPTIQHAVNAANPGDVIQADAGTYVEQVTIDKSLDISGAGAATTFIQAPSPMVGDASGSKNVVTITGSGVSAELSGFTIEGPGSADLNLGIYVRDGAHADIHDNILEDLGTGSNTLGILVGRNAHSTTGTATITDNAISGYSKGGIVVDNVGSSATISGNTVTGGGPDPVVAENGIQISRGATATVTGNTVSSHFCTSAGGGCTDDPTTSLTADGASGILLYASGAGVTLSGNTLTDNQYQIWTVGAADVEVRENTITGASGTGIAIWDSDQWTDDLGYSPVGTVATVANNTLSTHDYGVLVRDYTADTEFPDVTILENSITNSSVWGAWADVDVDASANWWGSNVPATVKATVNNGSHVDYTPWLADGTDTGDPGFQGDFSTLWVDDDSPQTGSTGRVQEGVDLVSGSTVNLAAGTYTAVDRALAIIDKPLTLVGAGQADDSTGTILDGGTYGTGQDTTGLGSGWPRAIVVQSDDVTIRNMRIREYQGDLVTVGGYAIVARASSSWGVTEPTLDDILIEDITFEDCYVGVRAEKVTGLVIQDTLYGPADGSTDYAQYVTHSDDTVIRANTVNVGSIWVTAASNALIGGTTPADGNVVTDATYNGIWLGQQFASGTSSSGTIQYNTVNGAWEGGIVVWNWPGEASSGISILDNIVSGAESSTDAHGGISVWDVDSTPVEIRRNESTGNTFAGISLQSSNFTNATVSNNIVSDNLGDGVYIGASTLGSVTFADNSVHDSGGLGMTVSGSTGTVDASGNWWGSSTPAGVKASANAGTGVDYTPWLAVGTDQDGGSRGFAGDFSTLWADDDSPQTGSKGRVQEGIDLVSGSTLYLANGLYKESNTLVDKTMIVEGESGSGVVIAPAAEDTGDIGTTFDGSYQHGFMVTADNVTIKKLTVDGTGNNLANGGSLPDHYNFRVGILNYADGDDGYNALRIENVTVTHIRRRGIALWPGSTYGHVVTGCSVDGIEYQQAIYSAGYDVTIHGNTINDTGAGINLMPSLGPADPGSVTVTDNELTNIGAAPGRYYGTSWPVNAIYYRNPNYDKTVTITGNRIHSLGDGGTGMPGAIGMYIYNADASSLIDDNEIDTTGVTGNWGIYLGGCAGTTVSNNTFTMDGDDSGLYLGRGNPDPGLVVPNVVTGNTFQSSASTSTWVPPTPGSDSTLVDGAAIVQADDGNVFWMNENPYNTENTITDNSIDGFAMGILMLGNGWSGTRYQVYADIGGASPADSNDITNCETAVRIVETDGSTGGYMVQADIIGNGTTISSNDVGIDVDGGSATINDNTINGNDTGVRVRNDGTATLADNAITGNTTYGLNNTTGSSIDAELNWWGSACGPSGEGPGNGDAVSTDVDYSPWWADAGMTSQASEGGGGELVIPTGATTAEAQAILDCAAGKTVMFESGSYPGGLFLNGDAITLKLNGCTVGPGSPAFTIVGDDETIVGPGKIDGGGSADPGILVLGGADNFILDSVEVTGWANGMELAGDVTSFKLISNWIHSNSGHGLLVDTGVDLSGVVTIEGNLFKVNGGNGIQHDGNGTLPAEYNSWGDPAGPSGPLGDGVGGVVDSDPWTYVESFFDVWPDTLALERHVPESTSFDVALKADAKNLYGLSFKFSYDTARLTLNSTTFSAPWAGKCYDFSSAGTVSWACYLAEPEAEWTATAGTIATFNFTTAALPGGTALSTYLDISHLEADTSAGAKGGVKVFVNNAGFNDPSVADRDITDSDDGEIIVEPTANYSGFVDLQGRANDSAASIKVYNQAAKSGAVLVAQGTSASSGAYATTHVAPPWLIPTYTYWMVVDRDLYLPTTPLAATDYEDSKVLDTVPLTALANVVLLGGDATNDDEVNIGDLSCIGGDYNGTGLVCGATGWSDVNGDGTVNIQDLSLAGGNYYKTSSPWTP